MYTDPSWKCVQGIGHTVQRPDGCRPLRAPAPKQGSRLFSAALPQGHHGGALSTGRTGTYQRDGSRNCPPEPWGSPSAQDLPRECRFLLLHFQFLSQPDAKLIFLGDTCQPSQLLSPLALTLLGPRRPLSSSLSIHLPQSILTM